MRIAGIDTETTGLDPEKGHELIEIGINMFDWTPGNPAKKIGFTWIQRIHTKRPIDPAAEAVHKISKEMLVGQPTFKEVAPTLIKLLKAADLLVAHNMEFDSGFVAHQLLKSGFEVPNPEVFCTMEEGRSTTPMGNVPNLGALCWAFDVDYDPSVAHAADYDIDKTMECFFTGIDRNVFIVPSFDMEKTA